MLRAGLQKVAVGFWDETGAEVTLSVLPCSKQEIAGFGAVRVDKTGKVIEFVSKDIEELQRGIADEHGYDVLFPDVRQHALDEIVHEARNDIVGGLGHEKISGYRADGDVTDAGR